MLNQNVRYALSAGDNNPLGIHDAYKPPRFMFEARTPLATDGENEWVFINTLTGDLYIKSDTWQLKYNIGGGSTPGTVSSASNVGGFEEVFKQLNGVDLEFRTLASTDGSLYITQEDDFINLQVPAVSGFVVDAANVGSGVGVYKTLVADQLRFRSLSSIAGDIAITLNGNDDINLTLTTPPVLTASSLGDGTDVYAGAVAQNLQFKSLKSSTGKITLSGSATEVNLGVNLTSADVGLGFANNVHIGYATFSPGATADVNAGFVVGSIWSQVGASNIFYVCTDNTAGAAQWSVIYDSATPYPIVYAKDYASQHLSSSFTQSITAIGPAVIAPPGGFAPLNARGSWSINQNNGFGAYGLRRNSATDGENNNSFLISVSADVIAPSLTGGERNFSLVAYVNNLSTAISGSGGNIAIRQASPSASIHASLSRTFIYKTSTASAVTFYFGVLYPNYASEGNFNLTFENITVTIVQT